jgi:hypothetical protein
MVKIGVACSTHESKGMHIGFWSESRRKEATRKPRLGRTIILK